MFKGMLDTLPNDSSLATILGHEMAHAILKHGVSYTLLNFANCQVEELEMFICMCEFQ